MSTEDNIYEDIPIQLREKWLNGIILSNGVVLYHSGNLKGFAMAVVKDDDSKLPFIMPYEGQK